MFPVTYLAASDGSERITAATSFGAATWTWSGLAATNARTLSVTHPVSVTGGCTQFAAIGRCAEERTPRRRRVSARGGRPHPH